MSMYRVQTSFTGAPVTGGGLNTLYFEAGGGLTAADAHDAVVDFWTLCAGAIDSELAMTVLGEIAVIDEATGTLTGVESATPVVVAGGASGDALPLATQGLIRWRTGEFVNGREVRGRTFVPGPVEVLSTGGRPESSYVGGLNTAAAGLIAETTAALLIWHRPGPNAVLEPGSSHPVLTGSTWSEWAVLRSRRD